MVKALRRSESMSSFLGSGATNKKQAWGVATGVAGVDVSEALPTTCRTNQMRVHLRRVLRRSAFLRKA
jgi:hypothetical protein